MEQGENPAVRRIGAVQQNHRQWTVRYTDAAHLIDAHIAILKDQDS